MAGFLTGKVNEIPDRERELCIVDTFVLKVHWLSPKERDLVAKACLLPGKRGVQEFDREKHARAYTRRVIKGWRGLTLDILVNYLKIEIFPDAYEELKKLQKDNGGEIPFTQSDSEIIYLNALADKYSNRIKETMDEWDEEDASREEDTTKK